MPYRFAPGEYVWAGDDMSFSMTLMTALMRKGVVTAEDLKECFPECEAEHRERAFKIIESLSKTVPRS